MPIYLYSFRPRFVSAFFRVAVNNFEFKKVKKAEQNTEERNIRVKDAGVQLLEAIVRARAISADSRSRTIKGVGFA